MEAHLHLSAGTAADVHAIAEALKTIAAALTQPEDPIPEHVSRLAPQQIRLRDVLQILRNIGYDVECGACMSIAFTGSSFVDHTCTRR